MPPTSVPLPIVTPQDLLLGLTLLAPVLVVLLTAIVVLIVDLVITDWLSRRPLMWISALACWSPWPRAGPMGRRLYRQVGLRWLPGPGWVRPVLRGTFPTLGRARHPVGDDVADRAELVEAEFYIMVLFCTSGLMLMASGNELMSIYLALEVTSLSLAFLPRGTSATLSPARDSRAPRRASNTSC